MDTFRFSFIWSTKALANSQRYEKNNKKACPIRQGTLFKYMVHSSFFEDVSLVGLSNSLTNYPERINRCRLFPVFVLSSLVMTF